VSILKERVNMDSKKTIIKLYEEYISKNNKPTKEYLNLKNEFEETVGMLSKNISDSEKSRLERVCECLIKMNREQETNAFVEGYTLGTNLTTEAINRGIK